MADTKISALPTATTPLAGTEVLPIVQSGTTDKVAVSDLTAGRDVATKNITAGTTSVANTQVSAVASASTDANEPEFNLSSTVFANLNKPRVKSANGTLALLVESGSTSTFQKRMRVRLDGGGAAQATLQSSTDNGASYTDQVTLAGATGDLTVNTGNIVQGTAAKGINFTANTPAAGMTSQLLNWYEEGTWSPNQGAGLVVVGAFSSSGTYTRIGRQVTVNGNVAGATSVSAASANEICTNLPFTVLAGNSGVGAVTPYTISLSSVCFANQTTTILYNATAIPATALIIFTVTYFI